MRVLVTGGAGYIGSHTAQELVRSGHLPVVLDNLSEGHRWAVRWGAFVQGDLVDRACVRDTLRDHEIDAVIHFAASAYVGESVENPRKYFQNNVTNTLTLLDEMLQAGVQSIVFSSTCATYGEPERLPIDERHPQRPVNPYGESKLFVERVLQWYGQAYGLKWMALRYFNAAGADPNGKLGEMHEPETHLIPRIIQGVLVPGTAVEVFGVDYPTRDGTAIRDYIHVSDLATAHVEALDYLQAGGESQALNLGTGNGYTVREVIAAVERITGARVAEIPFPRRSGDPPALIADATRAGEILGWQPRYSDIDQIVSTAWQWHRSQGERQAATASAELS